MNFDAMSAEEIKDYIDNITDFTALEEQLSACSFAYVKRTYSKYFGFPPVSTMSRPIVQGAFRKHVLTLRRADAILS